MQEGGRHGFVAFVELSSVVAALRLLRCESRSPSLRLQRAGRGVDHCGDGRCAPLEPIIRHIASRRTLFAWSSPCFCKESQTNTAAPASSIFFPYNSSSTTNQPLLQPSQTTSSNHTTLPQWLPDPVFPSSPASVPPPSVDTTCTELAVTPRLPRSRLSVCISAL